MKIKYDFFNDEEILDTRALKKASQPVMRKRAFDDEQRKEKRGVKKQTNRRPREDFSAYDI